MARKESSTILQEELSPPSERSGRGEMDDARLLDLDGEQESPFLRGRKRVPVRRGPLPKKTAARITWVIATVCVLLIGGAAYAALHSYAKHSWRFRIESSDDIEITGLHNVSHGQIMEVLGGDIGRNTFFVPLAERKAQLEQIPWVESASVMRFVPNHLKIEIKERTPVAFARIGSRILLIDAGGVLMELPANSKSKFSFPVVVGATPGEPLSTRASRMKIYNDLVRDLDSGGASYSRDISEVDLSDPDDVKVLSSDPQGEVLVHLGSSNYLARYKIYVAHVQEWRQQFDKLDSVDLRYDRQIVVNPDQRAAVRTPPVSVVSAKAAAAAGVKPAALVSRVPARPRTVGPMPVTQSLTKKPVVAKLVARTASKPVKKRAPKKKPAVRAVKARPQPKPAPPVVQAADKGKLPAPSQPASRSASRKPSPSIKNEDQR